MCKLINKNFFTFFKIEVLIYMKYVSLFALLPLICGSLVCASEKKTTLKRKCATIAEQSKRQKTSENTYITLFNRSFTQPDFGDTVNLSAAMKHDIQHAIDQKRMQHALDLVKKAPVSTFHEKVWHAKRKQEIPLLAYIVTKEKSKKLLDVISKKIALDVAIQQKKN